MNGARCLSLVALAALLFVPLGTSSSSVAATVRPVTISGDISGISGGKVMVLSARGNGWIGAVRGQSFQVRIPARDRVQLRDATLQVISASGRYVGPVVLEKVSEKKNPACGRSKKPACVDDIVGLGSTPTSISLGRLVGKDVRSSKPTWYLASKAPSIDKRDAVRAATKSGRPYGAGDLGLVRGGIPATSITKVSSVIVGSDGPIRGAFAVARSSLVLAAAPLGGAWLPLPSAPRLSDASTDARAKTFFSGANPTAGTMSDTCPTTTDPLDASVAVSGTSAGSAPGQELDCSGVPNVLNVDVNGNGVLNGVDTSAASEAASPLTIGATILTAQNSAVSYYSPGGITPDALASFLDPQQLPHQDPATFNLSIVPGQLFPGDDSADVTMTVDCGSLAWCSGATLFDDTTSKPAGLWAQSSPPYALTANPLFTKATYQADVLPPIPTDIPTAITPGEIVTLNGVQTSSGATASTTMEVGPYFASTPYVQGATFANPNLIKVDSAGNTVSASSSGTIALKIERPERLPLPGETTSSGVMDTSGLDYWVSISNPTPPGPTASCPASAYSNISGATISSEPNGYGSYTLVDNTTQDFDPAASGNPGPIGFTVDLSACEANGGSGFSWISGNQYQVEVATRGVVGSEVTAETFDIVAS